MKDILSAAVKLLVFCENILLLFTKANEEKSMQYTLKNSNLCSC